MTSKQQARLPYVAAIILSVLANVILGASSLYWRALSEVPPLTLVTYRIALSTILLTLIIVTFQRLNRIKRMTKKTILLHFTSSLLIATNWGVFIWSSINGYILECGIGYLLAPFISVALGVLIYQEPINTRKTLSNCIALSSVVALIIFTKNINHWTYLLIATTWGLYTYMKKSTPLDAITGLFVEMLFLAVCITLAISIFKLPIATPDKLIHPPSQMIWFSGIVSTIPLLMFSYATGKIPLSLTGLVQFILPLTLITISLNTQVQNIPGTSFTLILATAGILIALISYDTIIPQSKKEI